MILTGRHPVVQIHPTLRCNLRCLHCYSSSGPEAITRLDPEVACAAVRGAASCGYQVLAVSGGEPFLYEGLGELLGEATSCGMGTAVTSNGTILNARRLAALADRLDLLTISIDGTPDSHDRIRNRRGVFTQIERRLDAVRDSGIRFGFIFTLTQRNVHELSWVADFALAQGAALLQIHPLEMAGRAQAELADDHPDSLELGVAFAEALRLREEVGDRIRIHIDVATRNGFRQVASLDPVDAMNAQLSEVVSPLVIEADGVVVPLTYGFPRTHALGDIHRTPLPMLGREWLKTGYERLHATLSGLHVDDVWPDLPVLNIYEAAVEIASGSGASVLASASP